MQVYLTLFALPLFLPQSEQSVDHLFIWKLLLVERFQLLQVNR
jgi:hypothetical protein